MTKEEFIKLVQSHDWYYHYSDDSRYYNAGRVSANNIMSALKENPEYQVIYDELKPKHL